MEKSRKIVVRLPAKEFTFEESAEILRQVLGHGGCLGCFSGVDVSFVNEVELVVSEGGQVAPVGVATE
jgi:hypothetical protein